MQPISRGRRQESSHDLIGRPRMLKEVHAWTHPARLMTEAPDGIAAVPGNDADTSEPSELEGVLAEEEAELADDVMAP